MGVSHSDECISALRRTPATMKLVPECVIGVRLAMAAGSAHVSTRANHITSFIRSQQARAAMTKHGEHSPWRLVVFTKHVLANFRKDMSCPSSRVAFRHGLSSFRSARASLSSETAQLGPHDEHVTAETDLTCCGQTSFSQGVPSIPVLSVPVPFTCHSSCQCHPCHMNAFVTPFQSLSLFQ